MLQYTRSTNERTQTMINTQSNTSEDRAMTLLDLKSSSMQSNFQHGVQSIVQQGVHFGNHQGLQPHDLLSINRPGPQQHTPLSTTSSLPSIHGAQVLNQMKLLRINNFVQENESIPTINIKKVQRRYVPTDVLMNFKKQQMNKQIQQQSASVTSPTFRPLPVQLLKTDSPAQVSRTPSLKLLPPQFLIEYQKKQQHLIQEQLVAQQQQIIEQQNHILRLNTPIHIDSTETKNDERSEKIRSIQQSSLQETSAEAETIKDDTM